MPKRYGHSSLKQDNSTTRSNAREASSARDNRMNVGSVVSNESGGNSQASGLQNQTTQPVSKAEPLNPVHKSTDNISINLNLPQTSTAEHTETRHISFAFAIENDRISMGSQTFINNSTNDFENVNDSTKLISGNEGDHRGSVPTPPQQSDSKNGSNTQINQKRNSIKTSAGPRRPSLKYRDRQHRKDFMNNFSMRRKHSYGTSMSHASEDRGEESNVSIAGTGVNQTSFIEGDPVTGDERSKSHILSQQSNILHSDSQVGEFCEVDEVDFNRCFPWVKTVIRFLSSISYDCSHANCDLSKQTKQTNGEGKCAENCFLKLYKNSRCLIEAVSRMFETSNNLNFFEKYNKKKNSFNSPGEEGSSEKNRKVKSLMHFSD